MGFIGDVLGSVTGSTARDAGKMISGAADKAQGLWKDYLTNSNMNLSPFLGTGQQAALKLATLLGLRPQSNLDQYYGQNLVNPDGTVNQGLYDTDQAYRNAWDSGNTTDAQLRSILSQGSSGTGGEYGSLLDEFNADDMYSDPGYKFRLDEGTKGVNNALTSRGGYFSGAAGKALSRYNQDYASGEYGKAFDRNQTNKNTIYNFLSGTSNSGQTAANSSNTANQNYATNVADLMGTSASAYASGKIGQANQINKTLSNLGSTFGF